MRPHPWFSPIRIISTDSVRAMATIFAVAMAGSLAAAQPANLASGPLIVNEKSRIAVMEYEAWFGPEAANFQGSSAMPLLQSADMQSVGGGYDSADPAIIQQHVTDLLNVPALMMSMSGEGRIA